MPVSDSLDIARLAEDFDLEAKRAAGQHGLGELPSDFWKTYSAMANTEGGVILLGVEEQPRGQFRAHDIRDTSKVVKALWDGANNRQVVSENLLQNKDVQVLHVEGAHIIRVNVPRASRDQRPVHIGENPLTGAYRRNYEGDYRCDKETVRRMLAERIEDSRDSRLLDGFAMGDLDTDTVKVYRIQFRTRKPDHPWNDLETVEFLRSLGAWGRDRQTGEESVTLAGLLMFGRLRPILDALPHYVVDYQERLAPAAEPRWVDRLTTDGTWSGNLYDFYRQVIQRLYRDLKVPFRLSREERIDDTPVHEALREALTNALIHADYSGRVSVLVVKRSDLFGFRNPGGLRIPLRDAIGGGVSDCRNRNLQKMFQLVGLGEQAGSGLPKIFRNWREQHWRPPELQERTEPEQTLLTLRMISLLPDETIRDLDNRFGNRFRRLPEVKRLALATAALEGTLTHDRLSGITSDHPHDLTRALRELVQDGFLDSNGSGRGTYYFLHGSSPSGGDLFAMVPANAQGRPVHSIPGSVHNAPNSVHNAPSSVHNDDVDALSPEVLGALQVLAQTNVAKKRVAQTVMENTIRLLCNEHWLSAKELADLLGRAYGTLRIHYLNPMVTRGDLVLRYPERPNHPRQRYRVPRGREETP
jgi:predicted HTH transcriptional regulator